LSVKTEDLYKNKIRLIYEYNSKSPLFARIAAWELENKNYEGAIDILENGLREFPDFPTPYFLLGKTYCKTGEFDKAFKCYKKGGDLIHSKETYHYYLRELESIKKLKTPTEMHSIKPSEEDIVKKDIKESSDFEDNLDELAEKISRARMPAAEEKGSPQYIPVENSDSTLIVSETLAKIYLAQGEVQEAIAVYEKLARKDPARKDYFSNKISELRSKGT
jgi:tetratricopeptide (TPR) repeat protein